MTTEPERPGEDPRQLLSGSRELVRRVRATQRAAWFPLLVFAAVTFAAIPAYQSGHLIGRCVAAHGLRTCSVYSTTRFVYWPAALVLGYAAIAAFYIRRSRARGVGTRVRPYVIAGVILALAGTAGSLWQVFHPPVPSGVPLGLSGVLIRLPGPGSVIGVALLVLAWTERSRLLAVLALAYEAVVLLPVAGHGPSAYLPQLLVDGGVLLLGAVGFALRQRAGRPHPA